MKISYLILVFLSLANSIFCKAHRKKTSKQNQEILIDIEDAHLTSSELIQKYGYPCETYYLTTEDGYILHVLHVPNGKNGSSTPDNNKRSVIVQHGLLGSSDDFLLLEPENALIYALADAGYDVWIPDARGNKYSRNHTTLDPNNPYSGFWDFSWHEIGIYDIPTVIDYVLNKTGQSKLFHIGHSQGTTAFYVMASEKPEYNDKIIAQFSYAPSAYEAHNNNTFLVLLAKLIFLLQPLSNLIGFKEFTPGYELEAYLTPIVCSPDLINTLLCKNIFFLIISSPNENQINTSMIPVYFGHFPSGASTEQLIHYGQLINSKRFCQYDHGPLGNLLRYGSLTPPSYPVSKITTPLYFFYSLGDTLANYQDVETLKNQLPNVVEYIQMDDPDWSHFDYAIGISAKTKVYEPTIEFMNNL